MILASGMHGFFKIKKNCLKIYKSLVRVVSFIGNYWKCANWKKK